MLRPAYCCSQGDGEAVRPAERGRGQLADARGNPCSRPRSMSSTGCQRIRNRRSPGASMRALMTGWLAMRRGFPGKARGQVAPPNRRTMPVRDRPGLCRPAKVRGSRAQENPFGPLHGPENRNHGRFQGQIPRRSAKSGPCALSTRAHPTSTPQTSDLRASHPTLRLVLSPHAVVPKIHADRVQQCRNIWHGKNLFFMLT